MPFSFGGSKSRTDSISTSFSQDRAKAGSVSGGGSVAGSQDASRSFSQQSVAFEDVFSRLFGGAEGAAAGLDPSLLTEAANTLFTGGTGFLDSIGADAGTRYLEQRLGSDNEVLQQQIDLLGEDLGRFFSEELNPAITSEAVAGGTLGGGRQGVAQGRGLDAVTQQFTRGATALRAGDIASRDAAAGTLAENSLQGTLTALQGIPGLAGVADLGFSAGIAPYERLASILGGPIALTTAGSTSAGSSFSTASDFARSFSESFGVSRSRATSSSRGKSVKFGF